MSISALQITYALQFAIFVVFAVALTVRVYRNHFQRKQTRPVLLSLASLFGSFTADRLFRLCVRFTIVPMAATDTVIFLLIQLLILFSAGALFFTLQRDANS